MSSKCLTNIENWDISYRWQVSQLLKELNYCNPRLAICGCILDQVEKVALTISLIVGTTYLVCQNYAPLRNESGEIKQHYIIIYETFSVIIFCFIQLAVNILQVAHYREPELICTDHSYIIFKYQNPLYIKVLIHVSLFTLSVCEPWFTCESGAFISI